MKVRDARMEAQDIVRQAHRDAESYGYFAVTLETIRQAPQAMQQLALNYEAFQDVTQTALRRLGVAEKRIDLFGDHQDADPPRFSNWSWTGRSGGCRRRPRLLWPGSVLRPGM